MLNMADVTLLICDRLFHILTHLNLALTFFIWHKRPNVNISALFECQTIKHRLLPGNDSVLFLFDDMIDAVNKLRPCFFYVHRMNGR